jgi:hypothetical protein
MSNSKQSTEEIKMISMFNSNNSTDEYAVIVDGHLGLYDTKDKALEIYNRIGSIEDSAHGAIDILNPGYCCVGCMHDTHDDIANHIAEAEDLAAFMDKAIADLHARVLAAQIEERKNPSNFFDLFAMEE